MDLAPTILEMAGVANCANAWQEGIALRKGRNATGTPHGAYSRVGDPRSGRPPEGRLRDRVIPKPTGPERWQLYDLSVGPGEVHDLSEQPQCESKMKQMLGYWEQNVLECGIVPLALELGEFMQANAEQMYEGVWIEYEYWKEGARDTPKVFTRQIPRYTVKPV